MLKKIIIINLVFLIFTNTVQAIEEASSKKSFFNFFKKQKNEVVLNNIKKNKRTEVAEIKLPAIITFKKNQENINSMSLEDCINYAIKHNPNIAISEQYIKAAESGIGQQITFAQKH